MAFVCACACTCMHAHVRVGLQLMCARARERSPSIDFKLMTDECVCECPRDVMPLLAHAVLVYRVEGRD